jgi:hypothetical protein
VSHTGGFEYTDEKFKFGWICGAAGAACASGESISFALDHAGYRKKFASAGSAKAARGGGSGGAAVGFAWTLGYLSSYEGMGTFGCRIACTDAAGRVVAEEELEIDGQDGPGAGRLRVSVYTERRLAVVPGRAGARCNITVLTRPPQPGRIGNKVKLLSLGVAAEHVEDGRDRAAAAVAEAAKGAKRERQARRRQRGALAAAASAGDPLVSLELAMAERRRATSGRALGGASQSEQDQRGLGLQREQGGGGRAGGAGLLAMILRHVAGVLILVFAFPAGRRRLRRLASSGNVLRVGAAFALVIVVPASIMDAHTRN